MGLADFFGQFLDDTPWTLLEKDKVIDDQLSDMLPYRVYDQENNFFHNVNSTGFILDVAPVINPDLIQSLQTALQDYCPRDGSIQFISWSSPNLHEQLSKWEKNRVVNTPLMKLLTSKRLEHFQNMRFGTDDPVKCVPHNRKILVVGWVDKISSVQSLKELENFRRNLTLVFGGEGHARNLPVTEFIDFLSEIFHSRGDRVGERAQYDPDTPLNYQVPGAGVVVNRNSLTFMSHPDLSVSSASVHIVPKKWGFQLGQLFHGAPEKVNDAPHGPVLISLTARSINAQKTNTDLIKRRAKIVHAEATNFHKFQPGLPDLKQEVDGLLRETEAGERLFETMTTVSAYARGGSDEAHAALGEMRKIWRSIGVTLQEDTFMQLPVFQTSLPFGMSGAIAKDMNRAGRLKKRKGAAVAHLAPLHGEWTGSGTSKGMLLVGRQGQVFDFDPFASAGNYNISVVGKSGAGKSVFMQELASSIYSAGGMVLVIDDGYSFKTLCEAYGGEFVGIGRDASIRINPFSMLDPLSMLNDEYRMEVLQLITRVIGTMANLSAQREGNVDGIEEEYIQNACMQVWQEHGCDGSVTLVRDLLKRQKDPRLKDVVLKLSRYCVGGIYGTFFDGPANLSVNNSMTVFELSELKTQKELEAVVLQIIMFLGTEIMFKTDRSKRVGIFIDEAWDMLGGTGTANFLEGVVRRARKYTGTLVTGTQSLNDYFSNPAANVCFENSDWTIVLGQKKEVIDKLVDDGRLSINPGTAYAIKTLTTVQNQFSEFGIRGADGWAFGRLVVDPYALAAYSTKGATVQRLKELRETHGLGLHEAIEEMVNNGEVS